MIRSVVIGKVGKNAQRNLVGEGNKLERAD